MLRVVTFELNGQMASADFNLDFGKTLANVVAEELERSPLKRSRLESVFAEISKLDTLADASDVRAELLRDPGTGQYYEKSMNRLSTDNYVQDEAAHIEDSQLDFDILDEAQVQHVTDDVLSARYRYAVFNMYSAEIKKYDEMLRKYKKTKVKQVALPPHLGNDAPRIDVEYEKLHNHLQNAFTCYLKYARLTILCSSDPENQETKFRQLVTCAYYLYYRYCVETRLITLFDTRPDKECRTCIEKMLKSLQLQILIKESPSKYNLDLNGISATALKSLHEVKKKNVIPDLTFTLTLPELRVIQQSAYIELLKETLRKAVLLRVNGGSEIPLDATDSNDAAAAAAGSTFGIDHGRLARRILASELDLEDTDTDTSRNAKRRQTEGVNPLNFKRTT